MRLTLNATPLALLVGLAMWFAGPAMARDVLLGSIIYDADVQPQVFEAGIQQGEFHAFVGGREGEFRGFRFAVHRSDVEMLGLRFIYSSGQTEDVRISQIFRAGTSSRVIELANPRRALQQVNVSFLPRGPAHIEFFAVEGSGAGAQ